MALPIVLLSVPSTLSRAPRELDARMLDADCGRADVASQSSGFAAGPSARGGAQVSTGPGPTLRNADLRASGGRHSESRA